MNQSPHTRCFTLRRAPDMGARRKTWSSLVNPPNSSPATDGHQGTRHANPTTPRDSYLLADDFEDALSQQALSEIDGVLVHRRDRVTSRE